VRARHGRRELGRVRGGLCLDVAGNLAAAFDLDLAVANRSGDAPARLDQEPLAHHQIALEATMDLRVLKGATKGSSSAGQRC